MITTQRSTKADTPKTPAQAYQRFFHSAISISSAETTTNDAASCPSYTKTCYAAPT
jgi:hypothetical protein